MSTAARAQAPDVGGRGGPPGDGPRFALRFEDGRGRLHLAQPLAFAFGVVDALELDLGPLSFPLDLSTGPGRFRTRRTRVHAARVRLDLPALLAAFVEEPYEVRSLSPVAGGLAWALRDPFGTVAFETRARFEGAALSLAVDRARAATEGPAAPLVRVHAAARALGLGLDEERGVVTRPRALSTVLAHALCPHGWRRPDDRSCRLSVEVLGSRRVALTTLDAGAAEPAAGDPAWERARRVAPVVASLSRGALDEARRRWRELRERTGDAAPWMASEGAALGLEPPATADGPVGLTVALRAAIRTGSVDDAAAHARALAAVEPCDAVAVEALCAAADLAADTDPSLSAALLERATARRPSDGRLALRLAGTLARLGRIEDFEATMKDALAAADPGPSRGALAREAATLAELSGHVDVAGRMWKAAVEQLPRDPRVLEGLGHARMRAGAADAALDLFDRAAAGYREDADGGGERRALRYAANAALAADRTDAAEARLAIVVERGGGDAHVYATLADLRRHAGALDAARRAEDRLLESLEGVPSEPRAADAERRTADEAPARAGALGATAVLAAGAERERGVAAALATAAAAALDDGRLGRARGFLDALARVRPDAGELASLRADLDERELRERASSPERLFELSAPRLVRALAASDDPSAALAAAVGAAPDLGRAVSLAAEAGALAADESPRVAAALAALVARHSDEVDDPDALIALAPHAPDDASRAAVARAASERFRVAGRDADAALALASAGATLRDTAMLRAALTAAERAGATEVARRIVELALDVVGDGPARAALEKMKSRLER